MLQKNKCIRFPGSPHSLDLTLHWLSYAISKERSHWEPYRWVWSHTFYGLHRSNRCSWVQDLASPTPSKWSVSEDSVPKKLPGSSQQHCMSRPSSALTCLGGPAVSKWTRVVSSYEYPFSIVSVKECVNTWNSFKWHRFRILNQFHLCQLQSCCSVKASKEIIFQIFIFLG